jgi:exportin-5
MQSSIVEPLLMFCTHTIRVRDTRCCGIILRVFRSIVPEFQTRPVKSETENEKNGDVDATRIPESTASVIREYISSNVLKACIESINEPYFVELHKELASLIATILACYCPLTSTPRDILLSLPNMQQTEIDKTISQVSEPGINSRSQRALVLELLKELKGVSISEMGKLSKSVSGFSSSNKLSGKKTSRSRMAQGFMSAPPAAPTVSINGHVLMGNGDDEATNKGEEGLEGVAGLFDQ